MNTPNGTPFICRVCDGNTFTELDTTETIISGKHDDTRETAWFETGTLAIGYECATCSVVFADAERFTKRT